ncbi:MAG TPA: Ig-like domain-containing protein [Thermoplasmata archaeon]
MRKSAAFILVAIISGIAFALAPSLSAYEGGVANSDREAGCISPCHSVQSSAIISMQASNMTPDLGASVTITVTVSGGQASNSPMGVLLLSSFGASNSKPSDAGWTITSDPSGTTFNFNQVDSYAGSATFEWTLNAPAVDGLYALYARIAHGGGETYVGDYDAGLTFVVGGAIPPGPPTVMITNPTEDESVSGDLVVSATIATATEISYALLSIDGELVDNKSAAPYLWTIDTKTLEDGEHTVNVTAYDTSGNAGYKEVMMIVDNAAVDQEMLNWIYTMAAGTVAIVALLSLAVVVALMIRRHVMGKQEGK